MTGNTTRKALATIPYWKGALIIGILFLCFHASSYAADLTLRWNANTEPDLAGYNVYYKRGSSGEPYDATINVGNVTTYSLHDLIEGATYFFVVSAYDTEGLESDYSNEISADATAASVSTRGGGGGCLIATAGSCSKLEEIIFDGLKSLHNLSKSPNGDLP